MWDALSWHTWVSALWQSQLPPSRFPLSRGLFLPYEGKSKSIEAHQCSSSSLSFSLSSKFKSQKTRAAPPLSSGPCQTQISVGEKMSPQLPFWALQLTGLKLSPCSCEAIRTELRKEEGKKGEKKTKATCKIGHNKCLWVIQGEKEEKSAATFSRKKPLSSN